MIQIQARYSHSLLHRTPLRKHSISKISHLICIYREVKKQYMKSGIFLEYERGSPDTIIKKTKMFKQRNYMRGVSEEVCSQTGLGFQPDEEEIKEEIKK